ncbi:AAA family ATPase [Candidatus Woesearchaeota archaeon]|nr:AAA family ATPase [Candidatus Woesearchaeota archaeon]
MKVIVVSGTPGTGKTRYAKRLAKEKNYLYIDINEFVLKQKIPYVYDRRRKAKAVDIFELKRKLISHLKKLSERGAVIDSHLAHYLPKRYVSLCIIMKCSIPKLKRRLKSRGYSEAKISENVDAELFDVCFNEALEAGHKVKVIFS